MKKSTLILAALLIVGCKKIKLNDAISDGAKLIKADAGKAIYTGTWWAETMLDSLVVIQVRSHDDSIRYKSNVSVFDRQLTHPGNYEPKDDNLFLNDGSYYHAFRIEH